MLNLFITGTDSNVGKTFITAGLAAVMQSLGYSTCVYKPVVTGAIEKNGFAQAPELAYIRNVDPYIKTFSTYLLKQPSAPAIAAENENILIDKNTIKQDFEMISKEHDCTIVNACGGIMTPFAPNFLTADMVKMLNLPSLIIVKPDFDSINRTIMTVNLAESKGIKIRGIIINDFPENSQDISVKTAPRLIEEYTNAKVLGVMKHFNNINKLSPSDMITCILNGIDIESVFDVKIAKLEIE